jgi:hypothetical protein
MIYTLGNDLSHLSTFLKPGDRQWDAELIYFDGWVDARFRNPKIDYTDRVPPVIEFVGNLEVMKWSDFPYTDQPYLVMSRKMLEVLLSIQPFKYRIYPTLMYDYKIDELVRSTFDGTRTDYRVKDSSLFTDKFIIMQLAETIDVLDEDKTILKRSMLYGPYDPSISTHGEFITARESGEWYFGESDTEHYEFTRDEKDLPPVFAAPKTPYFFTEAAVRALEANNIRGAEFCTIPQKLVTAL